MTESPNLDYWLWREAFEKKRADKRRLQNKEASRRYRKRRKFKTQQECERVAEFFGKE